MAAFAKGLYDAAAYSAFRPVYPRRLFDTLWSYHANGTRPSPIKSSWQRAVDLGCGTGQATIVTAERFNETIGVDPSPKMVSQATEQLKTLHSEHTRTIRYTQSPAENLPFLEPESVDFVGAAQAVHWFDHAQMWRELGRVLRPGGTAAFWGYSELRIKDFPTLSPLITYYSQGSDPINPQRVASGEKVQPEPNSLAAYWEQPGRSILDFGLTAVPTPPETVFDPNETKVVAFTGSYRDDIVQAYEGMGRRVEKEGCILNKQMDWTLMDRYCRTWSSLSHYLDAHPEEKEMKVDIVGRFLMRLKEEMRRSTGSVPDTFLVEWPMTVLLFRKRS